MLEFLFTVYKTNKLWFNISQGIILNSRFAHVQGFWFSSELQIVMSKMHKGDETLESFRRSHIIWLKWRLHTGVSSPLLLKSLLIWPDLLFFKLLREPFELFKFHLIFIERIRFKDRLLSKKSAYFESSETFLVSSTNSSLYIAYCILKTADCAWKNICISNAKNANILKARKKMHKIRQWDHKFSSSILKPSSDRIVFASGHWIVSAESNY